MSDKKLEYNKKTEANDGINYIKPSFNKTYNGNNQSSTTNKKNGLNYKFIFFIACIVVFISRISSCVDNVIVAKSERDLFAMDTYMKFTVYGTDREKALNEICDRVKELDNKFSIIRDGAIKNLNESHKTSDEEAVNLIKEACNVSKDTNGAFDITVYPLMKEWGFITKEFTVVSDERLNEILANVNYEKIDISDEIKTPSDVEVDLGGIVKGYTGDVIADVLKKYRIKCAIVSLGGNVEIYKKKPDGKPWKVAIENPDKDENPDVKPAAYLEINDARDGKAIVTSGDYERFFKADGVRYHHIIDPKTGKPANNGIRSVTIVSDDGTMADALSTALFVMGKDKATSYWKAHKDEFDFIMIMDDKKVYASEGVKDELSTELEVEFVK